MLRAALCIFISLRDSGHRYALVGVGDRPFAARFRLGSSFTEWEPRHGPVHSRRDAACTLE